MSFFNHAPPPYDDGDHRPAHLWKLLNNEDVDLSPYTPLSKLTWGHAPNQIEWEMNLRKTAAWGAMSKFPITRGPAGAAPLAYTFKKFTRQLVTADKNTSYECKYKLNRKANYQTLSVKQPGSGNQLQWTTNQVLSTVNGVMFDDTKYTFTDQWGTTLASFAWLCPDGSLDCCMQFTAEGAKCGLSEDVILVSFFVLLQDQWDTMLDEYKATATPGRLQTLEAVRNTLQLVEGRQLTYRLSSVQEADAMLHSLHDQHAAMVGPHHQSTTIGTSAMTAVTASI